MLTAYDFGRPTSSPTPGKPTYTFGVDTGMTAQALRKLAEDLESNRVLLQDVLVVTRAANDDFCKSTLILKLHETRKAVEKA